MVSPLWYGPAPIPKSNWLRLFGIGLRRFQSRNGLASLVSVCADSKFEMLVKMRLAPMKDGARTRIPSSTMGTIARELALRLAALPFPPDAVHTPGVGHIIADRLSRTQAPTSDGTPSADLHPALREAIEDSAPPRSEGWYKASSPPTAQAHD